MKKSKATPLILPKKLLVALSGTSIAMVIGLIYNAYNQLPINMTWLYLSLFFTLICLLSIVVDLYKNPIQQKLNWAIFLTAVPLLACFFYLIARERILAKSGLH